ncbi:MAG: hypothetical protein ACRCYX_13735 [Dermatophilaceae bacterium]
MAGDIAFTQAGFDQRIQQGTEVVTSLNQISTAIDGSAAGVAGAIIGSWGSQQTAALMEINGAVSKMMNVVLARNTFLGTYSTETWANDSEVAAKATTDGNAASDVIVSQLAGAGGTA